MTHTLPKFNFSKLVKPTLETLFNIDYEWWDREDRELRVYLQSHLCPEHRKVFETHHNTEQIDWIDEDTAMVTPVDGLQHVLRIHCSLQPGYIDSSTPLVDAIFRVFLANSNKPLTVTELGARLKRDPKTILRILSGIHVYKGIRPYTEI
jgi:hypothetical protein